MSNTLAWYAAGPFTLFAPTDDAFAALPTGALDSLVANPPELKRVLLSHVVPGTTYSRGLSTGTLALARGGTVPIKVDAGKSKFSFSFLHLVALIHFCTCVGGVKVADAGVIEADLPASNGVVHVINRVI